MRNLLLVGIVFLIVPPSFSYFQDPWGWKRDTLPMMAFAFGGPLLVIVGLAFSRWRKLTALSERGLEVPAIVERSWSTRSGHSAAVRYTVAGEEYRVTLEVPDQHWMIDDGASATVLVDPANPKNASLTHVRSALMELRDQLKSGKTPPR